MTNTSPKPKAAGTSKLSALEAKRLTNLEATVAAGLKSFITVGTALAEIQSGKLYRATHDTFAAYLQDRWELKRQRGYELIEAASTAVALSEKSDITLTTESHAAALAKLSPEDAIAVWDAAEATGKITAAALGHARWQLLHPKPAPMPEGWTPPAPPPVPELSDALLPMEPEVTPADPTDTETGSHAPIYSDATLAKFAGLTTLRLLATRTLEQFQADGFMVENDEENTYLAVAYLKLSLVLGQLEKRVEELADKLPPAPTSPAPALSDTLAEIDALGDVPEPPAPTVTVTATPMEIVAKWHDDNEPQVIQVDTPLVVPAVTKTVLAVLKEMDSDPDEKIDFYAYELADILDISIPATTARLNKAVALGIVLEGPTTGDGFMSYRIAGTYRGTFAG